jgi:uncharacterized protein (TIGR04222 family)
MNREQSALWQRLREFQIDDPAASFPFSDRLARENSWTRGYALRVAEEYKRFVFLAMVAGFEVTPSEDVDEAWHLHLTYTQSYWNGLCRDVLGKPLHHVPTRGPIDASRHFEQYANTLASYAEWFGHSAPPDIWPAPEARFDRRHEAVRVDRARHWIVPKPRLWPSTRRSNSLLAAAATFPVVWGVTNPLDMQGQEFLVFFVTISLFAAVLAYLLRQWLRDDASEMDPRPLTPLEVACLGGGQNGVLHSCVAGLIAQRKLEVVEEPPTKLTEKIFGKTSYLLKATAAPESAANDVERVMLSVAAQPQGAVPANLLKSAKPLTEVAESELQSRGLLESPASFGPAFWWPLLIVGSVWLLGLLKVVVGISRDKPVIFLVLWLLALAVVAVFLCKRPFRTRRGQRLFEELQLKHKNLKWMQTTEPSQIGANEVMLMAGLFGLAAVELPNIQLLHTALKPIPASDGGYAGGCGAGSSGCGGGGGGGGCGGGGCGGCGGGD